MAGQTKTQTPSAPIAHQQQPEANHQKKKRTSSVPKDEDKSQKFVRLAKKRVPRAMKAIRSVANLSAMGSYSYTQEQAGKVVNAIVLAVKEMASRFEGMKEQQEEFSL